MSTTVCRDVWAAVACATFSLRHRQLLSTVDPDYSSEVERQKLQKMRDMSDAHYVLCQECRG